MGSMRIQWIEDLFNIDSIFLKILDHIVVSISGKEKHFYKSKIIYLPDGGCPEYIMIKNNVELFIVRYHEIDYLKSEMNDAL